jgi:phosphate starvation-inducible PhoH-like protein
VKIEYRGNKVKIVGHKFSIEETRRELENLFEEAKKGIEIDEEKIKDTKSLLSLDSNSNSQLDLLIQTKKRKIIPRSNNQKKYFQLLNEKNIVFAVGPAGTGKTFLAVAKAVAALQKGLVNKIILSRPAVEAGEKLGFLPGDLKDKVDPFLRPIYDALYDMMPFDQVEKKINNGIIEIAPIAFMRGRTLENCFVILDEAQNTSKIQMKMFLTRLGKNSQMVVVGDITQIDLVSKNDSGLLDAKVKLSHIKDIGFVFLNDKDVVRHDLVKKIINAYDSKK